MMNYADLVKGTWFPEGGMVMIARAFTELAKEQGVRFVLNCEVNHIDVQNSVAGSVQTSQGNFEADIVVSGADYRHTEQVLLDPKDRVYTHDYWEKRTMSPSSLLYYVGLNKTLKNVLHHNLFFDEDFEQHAQEIYNDPKWPSKPLFYVSAASKTDPDCAPAGCENLFFLIPLAPGLEDSEAMRERYFDIMLKRLEERCGESVREHIVVKRSYAMNDFESDYHSFKGNAYGLANTLMQTAFMKPKMKSKKVKNLFYTGQLTVPGPGVPPAILSGQIISKEIVRQIKQKRI
jgi:phytoene desaturase